MTLLEDKEWAGWSDREIAKRSGVHHTMVGRMREQLVLSTSSDQPQATKGADGKTRKRPPKRKPRRRTLPPLEAIPDGPEPEQTSSKAKSAKKAAPKRHKMAARVAAQELLATATSFLKLKPCADDMEPLLVAAEKVTTLFEEYMQ